MLHIGPDAARYEVVAQVDDAPLVAHELPGEPQRLGDAARTLLVGVVEVLQTEVPAAPEQLEEGPGVVAAGDQHHLTHTRLDERPYRVEDHRHPPHGEQVLVYHPRQRLESTARPACQYHALHHSISIVNGAQPYRDSTSHT